MICDNLSVVNGHLHFARQDTVALAKQYGTPLYVMNEDVIRSMLREFKRSIDENYENGGMVAFASKACGFSQMFRIAAEEGCGVDVSSGGELYTALKAGFPAERIVMHGSCKTEEELELAVENGVGRIVVNDAYELRRLSHSDWEKQRISICASPPVSTPTPTVPL